MPFNDDADAPLVFDEDSDWRPVFSVHTPESEVVELAACEANATYQATLDMLKRDGITLADTARGQLAAFVQRQTKTAFLSAHARLKRGADA